MKRTQFFGSVAGIRGAHAPRVWALAPRQRGLFKRSDALKPWLQKCSLPAEKFVAARRRNQHARARVLPGKLTALRENLCFTALPAD